MSIYLNPKFEFNLSLVAENFYLNDEFDKVQRVLKNFKKEDEFYYWFRLKKEAQIIIQQQDYENGICLLYTSPSPRDKRQSRMPSSA